MFAPPALTPVAAAAPEAAKNDEDEDEEEAKTADEDEDEEVKKFDAMGGAVKKEEGAPKPTVVTPPLAAAAEVRAAAAPVRAALAAAPWGSLISGKVEGGRERVRGEGGREGVGVREGEGTGRGPAGLESAVPGGAKAHLEVADGLVVVAHHFHLETRVIPAARAAGDALVAEVRGQACGAGLEWEGQARRGRTHGHREERMQLGAQAVDTRRHRGGGGERRGGGGCGRGRGRCGGESW